MVQETTPGVSSYGPLRRWWTAAAIVGLVLVIGLLSWRITGQRVNLVVVNESGRPVQFAWQPAPFEAMAEITWGGCESTSTDLHAGSDWSLIGDNEILDSDAVDVPLFVARVAIEVRIDAEGGVHISEARPVAGVLDAPIPVCIGASDPAG